MKAELRVKPHAALPGQHVFEVWYAGEFIATVTGADGPGVRVISKHPLAVDVEIIPTTPPNALTVWIENGVNR